MLIARHIFCMHGLVVSNFLAWIRTENKLFYFILYSFVCIWAEIISVAAPKQIENNHQIINFQCVHESARASDRANATVLFALFVFI